MFIVNQSGTGAVNVDNVVTMEIEDDIYDDDNNFLIKATTTDECCWELGEYETKEQAEAVFEELLLRITLWEKHKLGKGTGEARNIFRMPKE